MHKHIVTASVSEQINEVSRKSGIFFAVKEKERVEICDFMNECHISHRWIGVSSNDNILCITKEEDIAVVAICFRLTPLSRQL